MSPFSNREFPLFISLGMPGAVFWRWVSKLSPFIGQPEAFRNSYDALCSFHK
jgi:Na+/alanine symporter